MEWWNYWIPTTLTPLKSMAIVSNHSLIHSSKIRRKSTSLSHRNPNQKGVRWTWSHQSPYFLFNFASLRALLIVFILILVLIYVIFMYLKLFEWSNLGGITKDVKEGLKEPKRIKSKELQRPAKFCSPKEPLAKMALLCEIILQPKGTRCEIKGLLWKGPSSAKSFCSPIAPLYENFRSCETHLWHTSVIS